MKQQSGKQRKDRFTDIVEINWRSTAAFILALAAYAVWPSPSAEYAAAWQLLTAYLGLMTFRHVFLIGRLIFDLEWEMQRRRSLLLQGREAKSARLITTEELREKGLM